MSEELLEIEIDQIGINPAQPRRHFSLEELQELADSIQTVGIIHPPVVRQVEKGYELISGERRLRAAKIAGLSHIKAIIRKKNSAQSAQEALIENIQRVDLSPIEISKALLTLMKELTLTQEELAKKIGKKRSTVANYLRLLTLPEEVAVSLDKGAITMGHAKAVLSLETEALQLQLFHLIIKEELSVRRSELAAQKFMSEPKLHLLEKADCHLTAFARQLQELLGTKVEIVGNYEKGYVKIEYYSLEDLNRLGSLIEKPVDL